ncbi:hypothetical protein, partial [Spirulina sp. 06S082]|uniref:hypothetical protein n=1 Tax=Spirulina sp. 06S082 TaxID=3110248 RepID=UPI002B21FAC0
MFGFRRFARSHCSQNTPQKRKINQIAKRSHLLNKIVRSPAASVKMGKVAIAKKQETIAMIKQSSLFILGITSITISIIGVSDGAIALTTQSDRLEYLYAQTDILRPGDRGEAVSELQK